MGLPGLIRDVPDLIRRDRWTPRAQFPPSERLGDCVFGCGDGVYLITAWGDAEDAVRGVGWAESDYWAQRAWLVPFPGGLEAPASQWGAPPSLGFLGRPEVLAFQAVKEFERRRLSAIKALRVEMAHYRATDGAFMYVDIRGADGLFYIYGSNKVRPDDLPVAIEFRLPEHDQ
jgi:hypothetical protein